MGATGCEGDQGWKEMAAGQSYKFRGLLKMMIKSHMNSYGFEDDDQKSYEFYMAFEDYDQKSSEFTWFLKMMIKSHMNSFGF